MDRANHLCALRVVSGDEAIFPVRGAEQHAGDRLARSDDVTQFGGSLPVLQTVLLSGGIELPQVVHRVIVIEACRTFWNAGIAIAATTTNAK
jgi:hypothetical protein